MSCDVGACAVRGERGERAQQKELSARGCVHNVPYIGRARGVHHQRDAWRFIIDGRMTYLYWVA
jgi:hypothetical protein